MTMMSEKSSAEAMMLQDAVGYLDERTTKQQQQMAMLLLEEPMDIHVQVITSSPDYLQIIKEAVSDGRLHIVPVQSPVNGRGRSNFGFSNDIFPLQVISPTPLPPQEPKTPSPPRNP
jgi:hypothetical protein